MCDAPGALSLYSEASSRRPWSAGCACAPSKLALLHARAHPGSVLGLAARAVDRRTCKFTKLSGLLCLWHRPSNTNSPCRLVLNVLNHEVAMLLHARIAPRPARVKFLLRVPPRRVCTAIRAAIRAAPPGTGVVRAAESGITRVFRPAPSSPAHWQGPTGILLLVYLRCLHSRRPGLPARYLLFFHSSNCLLVCSGKAREAGSRTGF